MLQPIFDAIGRQDADAALRLAREAAASAPDDAACQHALGLSLQLAGDYAAAAEALDRAIALSPHTASYHVARAALAMGQRDTDTASAALNEAISSDPNQLSAYVLAAHLAIARNDADDAERQLKLAQRVSPDHPIVVAIEGNLAQLRGDSERALKLLSAASQRLPDEPLILASLGLLYLEAGNDAFAEQALRRALETQPRAHRLRWALIEALRRQGHAAELPAELERILADSPGDGRALALLGDSQLHLGNLDAALDAYRRLISLRPLPTLALDGVLRALSLRGLGDQAVALLEEQLADAPESDELWRRRVALVELDPAAARDVLDRWTAAMPDSIPQQALRAEMDELAGDLATAEVGADAVLVAQPGHLGASRVKLRALLRNDPAAALVMAEGIERRSPSDYGKRFGMIWRGFALDRLDRCDEAAACWLSIAASAEGERAYPSLTPLPEEADAGDGGTAPRLLWGPPGSPVGEVVGMLRGVTGLPLLDDRFGPQPRDDGFWPIRPDGQVAGMADWRGILERAGIAPSLAVDWLPHWDGVVETRLPGNRLVAVIADPRDLLLDTLVFGGPQPWLAPQLDELVDWFNGALGLLAERIERAPDATLLIRAEELGQDPEGVAERLRRFLALDMLPPFHGLVASRSGVGGIPTRFPAGRWRDYRNGFSAAFARLAPVAGRLGFVD